jgi:glycyl-tRNA synthetase
LSKYFFVDYDSTGSIGKRYRRQDEIGTPFCITYDFESEKDNAVTVRDRDSMQQKRISIDKLKDYILQEENF